MGIVLNIQERGLITVKPAFYQASIPRENSHIGNRILFASYEGAICQASIKHIWLPLGFHGETIDRVFNFLWRISIEMSNSAADIRRAPNQLDSIDFRKAGAKLEASAPGWRRLSAHAHHFCETWQDATTLLG